jgi:hypothetical protein
MYVVDDPDLLHFKCKTFSDYPILKKLLVHVNKEFNCNMNSCVVNHYMANQSRKHPHADNESYIDQNEPICTFTAGTPREVYFYETPASSSPKHILVQQLKPVEGSVYVMAPTFQSLFKHQVQPGEGTRISVSFRRVKKTTTHNNNEWPYHCHHVPKPAATAPKSESFPVQTSPRSSRAPDTHLTPQESGNDFLTRPAPSDSVTGSTTGVDELLDIIKNLNKADCKKVMLGINTRLEELDRAESEVRDNEVDSLVQSIDRPLPEIVDGDDAMKELVDQIRKDLGDLNLPDKNGGVSTKWLMENPATTPFLTGQDIDNTWDQTTS